MRGQSSCGAASVGRDVKQNLGSVWRGVHTHRRPIDYGAQLDVLEAVCRGKPFGLGEAVIEALHGDTNQGRGVVTFGRGVEGHGRGAYGVAMLGDDKTAGLGS